MRFVHEYAVWRIKQLVIRISKCITVYQGDKVEESRVLRIVSKEKTVVRMHTKKINGKE